MDDADEVDRRTRAWIDRVVVGLDLCPHAGPALADDHVRFAVDDAQTLPDVATALCLAADHLLAFPADEVAATLVIFPRGPRSADELADAVRIAEDVLADRGTGGLVHLAPFHPAHRSGPAPDPADHVFRSPFPTVKLLRDRALRDLSGPRLVGALSRRNAALMRQLDPATLRALIDGELPQE